MSEYTSSRYEELYPKTVSDQVEGIYNASQTLDATTKSLFGLNSDSTPNDIFNFLGQFNLHCWEVQEKIISLTENRNEETIFRYNDSGMVEDITSFTYSYSIGYNANGVFLNTPKYTYTGSYKNQDASQIAALAQNAPIYCEGFYNNYDAQGQGGIVKIPAGATYGNNGLGYTLNTYYTAYLTFGKGCMKMGVSTGDYQGSVSYVYSSNRNAYPDNGEQNNKYYRYIGVPYNALKTAHQITFGSYIGSGATTGDLSIQLPYRPRLFILVGNYTSSNNFQSQNKIIDFSNITTSYQSGFGLETTGKLSSSNLFQFPINSNTYNTLNSKYYYCVIT